MTKFDWNTSKQHKLCDDIHKQENQFSLVKCSCIENKVTFVENKKISSVSVQQGTTPFLLERNQVQICVCIWIEIWKQVQAILLFLCFSITSTCFLALSSLAWAFICCTSSESTRRRRINRSWFPMHSWRIYIREMVYKLLVFVFMFTMINKISNVFQTAQVFWWKAVLTNHAQNNLYLSSTHQLVDS